eukprot:gene4184-6656_t
MAAARAGGGGLRGAAPRALSHDRLRPLLERPAIPLPESMEEFAEDEPLLPAAGAAPLSEHLEQVKRRRVAAGVVGEEPLKSGTFFPNTTDGLARGERFFLAITAEEMARAAGAIGYITLRMGESLGFSSTSDGTLRVPVLLPQNAAGPLAKLRAQLKQCLGSEFIRLTALVGQRSGMTVTSVAQPPGATDWGFAAVTSVPRISAVSDDVREGEVPACRPGRAFVVTGVQKLQLEGYGKLVGIIFDDGAAAPPNCEALELVGGAADKAAAARGIDPAQCASYEQKGTPVVAAAPPPPADVGGGAVAGGDQQP